MILLNLSLHIFQLLIGRMYGPYMHRAFALVLRFQKASGEEIDELIQVFMQKFAGDSMVSSHQKHLKVANSELYPRQPYIYMFWRCKTDFIVMGFAKIARRHQTIRAGSLLREQVTLNKLMDISSGSQRNGFHV